MAFVVEETGYEKTILSDLQGAWTHLRQSVADSGGFDGADRVLFHIDEAMSWETVRRLDCMPPLLLIITNLCRQGDAPTEVIESIDEVWDILREVQEGIPKVVGTESFPFSRLTCIGYHLVTCQPWHPPSRPKTHQHPFALHW